MHSIYRAWSIRLGITFRNSTIKHTPYHALRMHIPVQRWLHYACVKLQLKTKQMCSPSQNKYICTLSSIAWPYLIFVEPGIISYDISQNLRGLLLKFNWYVLYLITNQFCYSLFSVIQWPITMFTLLNWRLIWSKGQSVPRGNFLLYEMIILMTIWLIISHVYSWRWNYLLSLSKDKAVSSFLCLSLTAFQCIPTCQECLIPLSKLLLTTIRLCFSLSHLVTTGRCAMALILEQIGNIVERKPLLNGPLPQIT